MKKAAYFLLNEVLHNSPPNEAVSRCLRSLGYQIDYFAPDSDKDKHVAVEAIYGFRWILKNFLSLRWRQYDAYVCTTEEPVSIAGLLAWLYRKPLIIIADEIRAGSYRGTRSGMWKRFCRWALRKATLTIVNDTNRIALQRDYASLSNEQRVMVYPGCYQFPPEPVDQQQQRADWGVHGNNIVLGFSGRVSLYNGFDLALQALHTFDDIHLVTQPLGLDEMSMLLLNYLRFPERITNQQKRLSWAESWASMGGVDIGVSIYRNPAPQFQNMGISSNRLCMFLAMGVPVIVSRQLSFNFVEEYDCGYMVNNQSEFNAALGLMKTRLPEMKRNAHRCAVDYIDCDSKYTELSENIKRILA